MLRDQVKFTMDNYRTYLQPDGKKWNVLEIGIDGDERPGGNFRVFGIGNNYKTLDFLERLNPDFVADICDTKLPGNKWDLIIYSQTIEHVVYPIKSVRECYRLLRKGGYLILDCPYNFPYHYMPEYDDYWRFSHKGLTQILTEAGFKVLTADIYQNVLSSALALK